MRTFAHARFRLPVSSASTSTAGRPAVGAGCFQKSWPVAPVKSGCPFQQLGSSICALLRRAGQQHARAQQEQFPRARCGRIVTGIGGIVAAQAAQSTGFCSSATRSTASRAAHAVAGIPAGVAVGAAPSSAAAGHVGTPLYSRRESWAAGAGAVRSGGGCGVGGTGLSLLARSHRMSVGHRQLSCAPLPLPRPRRMIRAVRAALPPSSSHRAPCYEQNAVSRGGSDCWCFPVTCSCHIDQGAHLPGALVHPLRGARTGSVVIAVRVVCRTGIWRLSGRQSLRKRSA